MFRTRSTWGALWAELPSPLDCLALGRGDIAGPFRIGTADGVIALRPLFDVHPLVLQESLLSGRPGTKVRFNDWDRISFQWSCERFLNGHENSPDGRLGQSSTACVLAASAAPSRCGSAGLALHSGAVNAKVGFMQKPLLVASRVGGRGGLTSCSPRAGSTASNHRRGRDQADQKDGNVASHLLSAFG